MGAELVHVPDPEPPYGSFPFTVRTRYGDFHVEVAPRAPVGRRYVIRRHRPTDTAPVEVDATERGTIRFRLGGDGA